MHLIWTILIGFVVGFLAKLLTPGRDPSGFFITSAIGIAGSMIATYAGQEMHWYAPGQSAGFIGALVGAMVLLIVYHMLRKSA